MSKSRGDIAAYRKALGNQCVALAQADMHREFCAWLDGVLASDADMHWDVIWGATKAFDLAKATGQTSFLSLIHI